MSKKNKKNLVSRILGTQNERILKSYKAKIKNIKKLIEQFSVLDNEKIKKQYLDLKAEYQKTNSFDSIIEPCFALVSIAATRTLQKTPYDVQILGGLALADNNVAEMRTGEGKTLTACFPVCLYALADQQVHVVTVNDYLAERDCNDLSPLYDILGLSSSFLKSNVEYLNRHQIYNADIVYGTCSEFAFDFLRAGLATHINQKMQNHNYFALIDEVDCVLIDDAKLPIIISTKGELHEQELHVAHAVSKQLSVFVSSKTISNIFEHEQNEFVDVLVDKKNKKIHLTERSYNKIEKLLFELGAVDSKDNIYTVDNIHLIKRIETALKAEHLFHRNAEYLVDNNKVEIIDASTGRVNKGRRWDDGLHQAIEIKENVPVKEDNQPVASISVKHFFQQYQFISGMTGTADTEAYEFKENYNMNVVVIPTNKPIKRIDHNDKIFMTVKAKNEAIIRDIKTIHQTGQPILIGTASVKESDLFAKILEREGISFNLLNATNHREEAKIIANAGKLNAVTISTNMAGRGTDILLGGVKPCTEPELSQWVNERQKVIDAGGLHVISTTRNKSRRTDKQLAGRSGRQGDVGSSQFYVAFEDPLMKLFGGATTSKMMQNLGFDKESEFEHPMLEKRVIKAQVNCEQIGAQTRENLFKYDNVIEEQRQSFFQMRHQWLSLSDPSYSVDDNELHEQIKGILIFSAITSISQFTQNVDPFFWNKKGMISFFEQNWGLNISHVVNDDNVNLNVLLEYVCNQVIGFVDSLISEINTLIEYQHDPDLKEAFSIKSICATLMLELTNEYWIEHLNEIKILQQGIFLRSYAQKDPLEEFKIESFIRYIQMVEAVSTSFSASLLASLVETQLQLQDALLADSYDDAI